MTIEALVLADRSPVDDDPVLHAQLPALLPIGGKSVLQHCLEDLWEAGVRTAIVTIPRGAPALRSLVGSGDRFGMQLRCIETDGVTSPAATLARAIADGARPRLVARGDVLRGHCAAQLLRQVDADDSHEFVQATLAGHATGLAWLRGHSDAVDVLGWSAVRRGNVPIGIATAELGRRGRALLLDSADVFAASLDALEGRRFVGLTIDGRARRGSTVYTAPRATLASSVHATGIVRIGRDCILHEGVELSGRVEIGDGAVIDEDAQLEDTVVLPGTYVGRGVRLRSAIARGPWLHRVDLRECQRVDDPLLLAGSAVAAA
jgi:NDP-sugar pyrophosphorylase family protein